MQRSRGCRILPDISHLEDFANDRVCGPSAKSLKFGPYGAVVGEHMDDSAACTPQDRMGDECELCGGQACSNSLTSDAYTFTIIVAVQLEQKAPN